MAAQDVKDFRQEVLDESRQTPVLVDFWAPWCGPCRVLGPVLEKLADENEGAWKLAKVNTDENPEVAREYRIQSIPAVKLFVDGEVANEFVGALPEPSLRKWLADAIPSERGRLIKEARTFLDSGDHVQAQALLQQVLALDPANADAQILMAASVALSDPDRAASTIEGARDYSSDLGAIRDAVATVVRLGRLGTEIAAREDTPGKSGYLEAIQALRDSDVERALERLVSVVRLDRKLDDDGARKACLAIFRLLGEQSAVTRKHRKALEMALF